MSAKPHTPTTAEQIQRLVTAQGGHARWDRWALCCALDLRPSELEVALLILRGWMWSDATTSATLIRVLPRSVLP